MSGIMRDRLAKGRCRKHQTKGTIFRVVCTTSITYNPGHTQLSPTSRIPAVFKDFPYIDRAALKYGHITDLSFWYIMREANRQLGADQTGWFEIAELHLCSDSTIRRQLKRGHRVFWEVSDDGKCVYLYSPERVAQILGTKSHWGRLRESCWLSNKKALRSFFSATFQVALHRDHAVSVKQRSFELGVSERTLQRRLNSGEMCTTEATWLEIGRRTPSSVLEQATTDLEISKDPRLRLRRIEKTQIIEHRGFNKLALNSSASGKSYQTKGTIGNTRLSGSKIAKLLKRRADDLIDHCHLNKTNKHSSILACV